tara:strand:- start:820 stop:1038 length:219 start_codon:yes stop_codon:yes gene_type:complete
MKKILLLAILSLSIYSCVTVRFPETINIDISVPADFDIEKMEILVDTIRSMNANGKTLDGTIEFNIHKKKSN